MSAATSSACSSQATALTSAADAVEATTPHCADLLSRAVEALLADEAFKLKTGPASAAYDAALVFKRFLHADNECRPLRLVSEIVSMLDGCILLRKKKAKKNREEMWSAYHGLRGSESYIALWKKLSREVGLTDSNPGFYQYIGHHIFKQIIVLRHPVETNVDTDGAPPPPTYEEICGLRYTAGYVPRLLRKKLEKSTHPLKDDILLCIYDMLDDGDEEDDESQDWVKAVNRGGLTLVNNVTFDVFMAIECEVRKVCGTAPLSEEVLTNIASSEDVSFYWSLICGDWEKESSDALLQMVVNQYVKIRGFSHAKALVEQYKKISRKTTQKSKGIRKQLISQPAEEKSKD